MSVSVIVGGQFGSEGKGKVAHFWARERNAKAAIRVGGSNSGHTVIDPHGDPVILRHLPTAAILPNVLCVLSAGSYINLGVLHDEIKLLGLSPDRVLIDPNAMIVTEDDVNSEHNSLLNNIGSTLSGTGAAVIRRIKRNSSTKLAKDELSLKPYISKITPIIREMLSAGERVILEGTQGFGLSLLHSPFYPYVTSRDTTAASFVSEAGLSIRDVDEVVLVLRAFPIRVSGDSGPLPKEIDWDIVTKESQSVEPIIEYTSVTKSIRRVARFDPEIVKQAIMFNQPSHIVLNHLDYIDVKCRNICKLTDKATIFVKNLVSILNHKINYVGFGPDCIVRNNNHYVSIKDAKTAQCNE